MTPEEQLERLVFWVVYVIVMLVPVAIAVGLGFLARRFLRRDIWWVGIPLLCVALAAAVFSVFNIVHAVQNGLP